MRKKKIVVKVGANCDKCRQDAMRVASEEDGVVEIAIEGDDRDKLVVKGVGIDAASLARALRKKLSYAILESIEEVKPPPPPPAARPPTPAPNPVPAPAPAPAPSPTPSYPPLYYQPPCQTHIEFYKVVNDPYGPTPSCIIQ